MRAKLSVSRLFVVAILEGSLGDVGEGLQVVDGEAREMPVEECLNGVAEFGEFFWILESSPSSPLGITSI